jgi:hypothetical protein
MARAIILFLAKRLGLARVSKFETRPATAADTDLVGLQNFTAEKNPIRSSCDDLAALSGGTSSDFA